MAIVTRLYVINGPLNRDLHKFVDPSIDVNERMPTPTVSIDVDDAIPGLIETLDEYMQTSGYDFFDGNQKLQVLERPGNPGTVVGRAILFAKADAGFTQLFVRSADGNVYQLSPQQFTDGYIAGLVPSWTSGTQVTIGAGQARSVSGGRNMVLAAPQLVDAAVVGANGIDVGALANNNWYFIFVISDSTGVNPVAGLLSTSQNAPVLPAGYDTRRRVGSLRTNGAAQLRNFQVFGSGANRSVQYRDAISGRQRLTGGAATVVTTVGVSQFVAPTSSFARLQVQQRGTVIASLYDDPTQVFADAQRTVQPASGFCDVMRVSATRDMAYANAAAGGLLDIWVTGYEETV
jgi:hypothetical protein